MEAIITLSIGGVIAALIFFSAKKSALRKEFFRKIRAYNASMAAYGEVCKFNTAIDELNISMARANWKQEVYGKEEDLIIEAYLRNREYRQAVEDYTKLRDKLGFYVSICLIVVAVASFLLPKS